MKYLITGGAGFIGSHLVEKLVERGDQVVILDNFSTGVKSNIDKVKNKVKFVEGSILEHKTVSKLTSESDHVIHLAAALGVLNIIQKPLESLKINLTGTENILEAANHYRKPVLIASTSEVYGKNNKVPLSEEDDRLLGHPLLARWSYSESKAIDESLAYFYFCENKLPVRLVRFFNTVGPRQLGNYGMVLPRFIISALKGEPLQVYGTGEQIRCFCHVDDAVRALITTIDSEKSVGEVFNVGNNQQISIMELAKKVIEITDSTSTIVKVPYSAAYEQGFEDMQLRVPDISKIKRVLGWEPQIGLDDTIKDVTAFHKN